MKSPSYIRNADLHRDVGINPVKTVNQNFALSHLEQLRDNELQAAHILQEALHNVSDWIKRWKVKLNHCKSVYVDFTNKSINPIKLYR